MGTAGVIKPSILNYNGVLAVLATGGQGQTAYDLLRKMDKEVEVTPDTQSYMSTISACSYGGLAGRAFELFEEMGAKGIPVSGPVYSSLLKACGSDETGAYSKKPRQLIETMRSEKRSISLRSYNEAMKAAVHADEWDEVFKWTGEMKEEGIKPDVFSFMWLNMALRHQGEWEKALATLEDMRELGRTQTPFVRILVVQTCAEAGKWDEACDLLEDMKVCKLSAKNPSLDELIADFSKREGSEKAIKLIKELRENNANDGDDEGADGAAV